MNTITIEVDGTGKVTIDGEEQLIEAHTYAAAQEEAINLLVLHAEKADTELIVTTNDPEARQLIVSPTGDVTPVAEEENAATDVEEGNEADALSELTFPYEAEHSQDPPANETVPAEPTRATSANPLLAVNKTVATQTSEVSPTRREMRAQRESFLTQEHKEEPATEGWRGFLSGLGIRMSPNATEKAHRVDVKSVSQHWPGPRTIAIVNGKGGANKTPTTILLSAVFARYGGGGVLAYDNNQTRGTLGWRTEQGPHDATILDLLPRATDLLAPGAQSADLAHYVHHQTSDRYDVLRSKPVVLANEQRVNAADVDAIHNVASKFYRLIFIDSGNDESDPLWKRMIDLSDQLVVATTTKDEQAEAGALLLEALADRDERSAALADEAVVMVSESNNTAKDTEAQSVKANYSALAREVVTIPYDPAMVDGILRFDALRRPTQKAWLHAAAAVARGL